MISSLKVEASEGASTRFAVLSSLWFAELSHPLSEDGVCVWVQGARPGWLSQLKRFTVVEPFKRKLADL